MTLKTLGNGITKFFLSSSIYKTFVICIFMLIPAVPLCFISKYIGMAMLLWGAGFLLRDLFNKRNFAKSYGSLALLLICISYVITLLFYAKNDIVSTLNVYFWAIVEFFILFATDSKKYTSVQSVVDDIYKINIPIAIVAFISGIISLALFFSKTSIVMNDPEGINGIWTFGIAKGRNCGIFNNAIPMGNAMFIGTLAALWNSIKSKKKSSRIFYIITTVICYLGIQTTITRTYVIGFYLVLAVGAFAFIFMHLPNGKKCLIRWIASLVSAVLVVTITFGVTELSKIGITSAIENVKPKFYYNEIGDGDVSQGNNSDEQGGHDFVEQEVQGDLNFEREELGRIPNVFYPRSELWKVGLQVIPHSPIFGFTSGNRVSTSIKYGSGEYYDTYLKETGIITYHNAYFDIAVSAGLLVLAIMLAFLIAHVVRTLKVIFGRKLVDNRIDYSIMVAILATHVFFISLFLGVIIFNNVSVCLYFWIILGFTSKINEIVLGDSYVFSIEWLISKIIKKGN